MMDLLFIEYMYFLGLSFGLNFRSKVPLVFIIISSFLWGAVIISGVLFFFNFLHLQMTGLLTFLCFVVLLLIPLAALIFLRNNLLEKIEIKQIVIFSSVFFLINLLFHVFNFTLASIDSFALVMLGRSLAYEGFNPSTLYSFTSWGLMVPLIQSMSIITKVDYFVTLEVSFAISLISLFAYACKSIFLNFIKSQKLKWLITCLFCLIFITTPMFLIQSFYLHTNLPAATFFLLSVICIWFVIETKDDHWLILMILAMIGLALSRTESFIYSIPLILLLFANNKISYKKLLVSVLPYILMVSVWFIFLSQNSKGGTDILDETRLVILVVALFALCIFFLLMRNERFAKIFLPILEQYFLFPFLGLIIIMIAIKPNHMMVSGSSIIENMFISGRWGITFWVWGLAYMFVSSWKKISNMLFLNNIILSTVLIIYGLGFFRNAYRITWTDSANRLLTIVFPLLLLFAASAVGSYINSRQSREHSKKNIINN